MKRRSFLQSVAAGAAAAPIVLGDTRARASSPLQLLAQLAEPDNDRILIIVQLFGGNDGLNTVIPADDPTYYKLRPAIAVAKKDCWNKLGDIYLHPMLANGSQGGLAAMLEAGSLAIVQGIGYDNPNLSHFRSTDIWLSGINSSDPNVRLSTGWVGRYLEKRFPSFPQQLPQDPLAIQFGGFSLALMSDKGRMGIEVGDPSKQESLTSLIDTTDPDSTGTNYQLEYNFIADIANRSNTYAQRVQDAYAAGKSKLKGQYGSDSLSKQLAACAALIAGGLKTKVYVVSMGGFDTHVSQQSDPTSGAHPPLLGKLANSISQFHYDAQLLGFAKRTVGLTISEFGRRPSENGSLGTDHGAASVQFVFGTQVIADRFGQAPDLDHLDDNGDLAYNIDYRQVYADVLTKWFGLTIDETREVLNDQTITPLGVIQQQSSGVAIGNERTGIRFVNYPNPFTERTTLELTLEHPATVDLAITDVTGRLAGERITRSFAQGKHYVPFAAPAPGVYICSMTVNGVRTTRALNCVR